MREVKDPDGHVVGSVPVSAEERSRHAIPPADRHQNGMTPWEIQNIARKMPTSAPLMDRDWVAAQQQRVMVVPTGSEVMDGIVKLPPGADPAAVQFIDPLDTPFQRLIDKEAASVPQSAEELLETLPTPPWGDNVHQPHHYARFVIEPVTFINANKLPFNIGNVIKYAVRYDAKNGLEDLKKARRYLDIHIECLEREQRVAEGESAEDVWKAKL